MTPRSTSRGFMYTAPPKEGEENEESTERTTEQSDQRSHAKSSRTGKALSADD